jgi:3-deoxy-D-manno-octulosonate 8-phosphate phosphatase (KDO 8-P phosphatase)
MSALILFEDVKHFIFDIDGVLTDGTLLIDSEGNQLRSMNIKDGYAIQLAVKKGFTVSIISGAKGEGLQKRLMGLGVADYHLGITNKLEKLQEISVSNAIDLNKTLYMGDDMPDVEVMKKVLLPCCPSDACDEVKAVSKFISSREGGQACVREVIEKVLKLHHVWE